MITLVFGMLDLKTTGLLANTPISGLGVVIPLKMQSQTYGSRLMLTLELTDHEAELFKKFRQYQSQFETLEKNGVFEVKKGKAILSFSAEGAITNINFELRIK